MALDTESYESYLAPRVAAVQSERRPGQGGGALSSLAVDRNSSSSATSPKNENGTVGPAGVGSALYNLYDSPTLLPRTPLAPGEALKLCSRRKLPA